METGREKGIISLNAEKPLEYACVILDQVPFMNGEFTTYVDCFVLTVLVRGASPRLVILVNITACF